MALGAFVGAFAGGQALSQSLTYVDNLLGRPMETWTRTVQAENDAAVRAGGYAGNVRQPNMLPSPGALLEAWRRGFISDQVAASALHESGIAWFRPNERMPPTWGDRLTPFGRSWYSNLWRRITDLNISRPDAAAVMRLSVQGRLSDDQFRILWSRLGADEDKWRAIYKWAYNVPPLDALLQQRRLGRIGETDYLRGAAANGWTEESWRQRAEAITPLPGLYDLMRQYYMGNLREGEYARYSQALGHTDARARALVESSYFNIPSGPELVNLAVRDAWNEDVVRRWGYDDEFPEPMRFWMGVQGWDWGRSFTGQDGVRYPSVHWPKLLWRAHWQVLPPSLAYQMYRRLRPERIGRYRAQFPTVTPFTLEDLRTVLKVHDYPTKAREWLAAINSQPLRMYTIRTAYRLRVRDRHWAMEQLRDSGYIDEDATVILDGVDAAEAQRETAWRERMLATVNRTTAHEIIAGYGAGFVAVDVAVQRMGQLGFTPDQTRRFLALEDSRQLRETLREYLRAVRRDYLAGTMTDAELSERLRQAQIAEPQAQRYVLRWTGQRSLERRSMSSGQVAQQVATGALTAADGVARLLNLGWIQPDAQLLIQQAEARYLQSQARAAQQVARQKSANQKALLAAQRSAAQAVAQAQSRLRRTTPLAALKRWYCLGIRSGPWILARLHAQGYDTTSASDYLRQWAMECEQGPLAETPAVHTAEKLVARQTPRSVLKSWWQNGIATDQWIRQRLAALGYTAATIDGYISEWDATRGKKPGPKTAGPPPAP